jgi:hypothetical protein
MIGKGFYEVSDRHLFMGFDEDIHRHARNEPTITQQRHVACRSGFGNSSARFVDRW